MNIPRLRKLWWVLLSLAVCTGGIASKSDYLSARQKFGSIGDGKVPSGSKVQVTPRELNAYITYTIAEHVPEGLRNARVNLGNGSASGFAYIDFTKLRQAQGKPLSWFWAWMLEGERPVKVDARVHSGNGIATVYVDRLEISGVVIPESVLEYLVEKYVRPHSPNAAIGEPFKMGHDIDRLEIRPAAVDIFIRKQRG